MVRSEVAAHSPTRSGWHRHDHHGARYDLATVGGDYLEPDRTEATSAVSREAGRTWTAGCDLGDVQCTRAAPVGRLARLAGSPSCTVWDTVTDQPEFTLANLRWAVPQLWTTARVMIRGSIMKQTVLHVSASVILVAALAGSGISSAVAVEGSDVKLVDVNGTTVLNDGSVLAPEESFTFSFAGDAPETGSASNPSFMSCPEVREPAAYTVRGDHHFIADESKPQSTWLEPGQEVTWAVSGSHVFQWDIAVGSEAEAGVVVAKAKVSIDTKISNSWTWSTTQTVKDHNGGKAGYRAVLGQVGYKLIAVKEWYVAPCTKKKKTIVVIVPRKGDMSIGRQKK